MLHSTPPKIKLVDSVEFVLAHEILHTFKLTDQDHTAVILFSSSCTRIFFMRGHLIHTVLPTIYEGSESETVCDTAFAKILFEFDTGKLVALNRIILAGDSSRLRAETYFRDKWPAANVTRLEMVRPVLDEKLESMEGRISSFAVPIALALKTLDEHPKAPYDHNFLPARIREKQSVYRIAWHGVLLLGILFLFVIFMTYQSVRSSQNLNRARRESKMLSMQLMDLKTVAQEVDSLRAKIKALEKGTALIDSLNKSTLRWTPVLHSFSEAFQKAGPFSIVKAESNSNKQMMITIELNKEEQIAAMERLLRPFTVTSVVRNTEADDRWIQVEFACTIN
jgi:cell division protein FtsB